MAIAHAVPTIDISPYLRADASSEQKAETVERVKTACFDYGFLQVTGHGIPLEAQRQMLGCCKTLFDLPQDDKDELSLKNNSARRGYERIGEQVLDVKALPDQKEVRSLLRLSFAPLV